MIGKRFRTAWSSNERRYYFQDLMNGRSSWSKPSECDLELPNRPPLDVSGQTQPDSKPSPPSELPKGWAAAFDDVTGRYYYFMIRTPTERTWLKPPPSAADPDAPEDSVYNPNRASFRRRATSSKSFTAEKSDATEGADNDTGKTKKTDFYAASLWDADACRQRILDALSIKSTEIMRSIFVEVASTNQKLIAPPHRLAVPETVAVNWLDCLNALRDKQMLDYGADPRVTVSRLPMDQAASWFAGNDRRRTICCVSASNGMTPGGGYLEGSDTWEASLCRRMPGLHPSLDAAKKAGLYPFGPCKLNVKYPECFGDTLFTPKLTVARASQDHGFPVLFEEHRVELSVLSVVAPDLAAVGPIGAASSGFADDAVDLEVLAKAVISMFVAPVFKDARCTTLIVGPFGAGTDHAQEVAKVFAQALNGELPDTGMRLGQLFHEIHFALPPKNEADEAEETDDYYEVFTEVLQEQHITCEDLNEL